MKHSTWSARGMVGLALLIWGYPLFSHAGRFLNVVVDGSLSDWLVADRFYEDSEITDGVPLASTYTDVYVANDDDYLYIGFKLKGNSTINDGWMHNLYIDTDLNGGTGYNAGWMAGGYDRLIQYGGGGGNYTVYSFVGGAQGAWSWSFQGTILYAYNNDVMEWAIPRSMLGGATAARLQFLTEGGSVSVQTWASQFESGAKTYTFADTPSYDFTVLSSRGTPSPSVGVHPYNHGTSLSPEVLEPSPANGTQYVSLGWTMIGHVPASGGGTSFSMNITNHATLTWLWQTNVQLTTAFNGSGSPGGDGDGYYARGSTVNLTATPNPGYVFRGWAGDVPAGQTNDNPLALTMDRKRSVTANFGTFQGTFATRVLDGALTDWNAADVFYVDAEIADGSPAASTYSAVHVANDHEYLFMALALKGNSTIFDNWTHHVFLDTDLNPATGYNAGWMSGGYDLMVQYGAGGATYSVFSFSGGAQASWSWNFVTTILYAYNDHVIEWGIPRSALGGSTGIKVQLMTEGGDVGYGAGVTWASAPESQARIYTMAATPSYNLMVTSGRGTPTPSVGSHVYSYGTSISPEMVEPVPANGTQYVSLGWAMTGHSPVSGGGLTFTATVTNNAALTWLWQTNVQLARVFNGAGSIDGDGDGYYTRGSAVNLTAIPDAGYVFKGWSGDVPAGQTNDNPLALNMDRRRNVTANFGTFSGTFSAKTLDGSLIEWSPSDLFYSDEEIVDGAPLGSTYSAIYVANDHQYLYVGLQLKANSTIFADWNHNLLINTDLDNGTGYNAGWMSGGYDRLIQYGASGTAYGIFSFAGGSQPEWSWNFQNEILYAFNNDVIEWAIPRSTLGGSTQMKLQFLTDGGSVSVLTWAHVLEAQARIYEMAATPAYTVTVASARGTTTPGAGSHVYNYGTSISPEIAEPAPANGTQYVSLGWTMTGHSPITGGGLTFTTTVTNNAALTWLWQTNVQLTRAVNGSGSIDGDGDGDYARGSTVNLTATPSAGYVFRGWSGDVPAGQTTENPLALTMDQRRHVTANFGGNPGRFAGMNLDGSLSEWTVGDVFYVDAEISDGLPLNSTYSEVRVANDHQYLYVGLQLKGHSTIFADWMHGLFIDTDLNPATGWNAGWMAGGYDHLVQYGGGGGNYSIYSFSGGSQSSWSWDFQSEIMYAFNDDVIEWAIPRSVLGGATEIRLQFLTEGGSVSVQTWAHQGEAQAKVYAFAATPSYTVTVASARGTAIPSVGSHVYSYGASLSPSIAEPSPANGTQYVSLGWNLTGNSPVSGGGTSFSTTITNNAALTWLWQTNVLFTRSAGPGGGVSGDTDGYYSLSDNVSITATPDSGYTFAGWTGAVPAGSQNDNPLNLTMDRARSLTATFQRDLGRYVTITVDGSLAEWVGGDLFYADSEITDGAPLSSTYSAVSVANDTDYLYIGLQLKAAGTIINDWIHNLYIDIDQNAGTGYNAGWMSGGYDRLVQYGAGGGSYSIFAFSGGTQADWSWSFLAEIIYAFDGDRIEWAIPRAVLGGATEVRLQFSTAGGSVSIETWASEFESNAKTYAFSTPDGCVPGLSPTINTLTDRTIEALQTLTFTVTAHDLTCAAPLLEIAGKPAGATFTPSVSGTNRVGSFSWTPTLGDVDTHLVRFITTDDEGNSFSRLIRIYVAEPGEQINSAGVPHSQTNWAVEVTELESRVSGVSTVRWSSVSGIPYDLYTSPGPFGPSMTWSPVVPNVLADASTEEAILSLSGRTNFIQVVPAGSAPNLHGVWGVIEPTIPSGYSLMSAPLDLEDLSFAGEFGQALSAALDGANTGEGDMVMVMEPNGAWRNIYLMTSPKQWSENLFTPSAFSLAKGQGFYVRRMGGPVSPRFAGPVGNTGNATVTINGATGGRWNIIGLSHGMSRSFAQSFPNGNSAIYNGTPPTANWNQNMADVIAIDIGNGVFRRVFRAGNGNWLDASTLGAPNFTFAPGATVYFLRIGGSMSMDF